MRDIIAVVAVVVLVAALLDVQTGVSVIDEFLRAIPLDWLRDWLNL